MPSEKAIMALSVSKSWPLKVDQKLDQSILLMSTPWLFSHASKLVILWEFLYLAKSKCSNASTMHQTKRIRRPINDRVQISTETMSLVRSAQVQTTETQISTLNVWPQQCLAQVGSSSLHAFSDLALSVPKKEGKTDSYMSLGVLGVLAVLMLAKRTCSSWHFSFCSRICLKDEPPVHDFACRPSL